MSTLVLELNDSSLTASRDGEVVATEPGYALRVDDGIVTGGDACARARISPQLVSNRHWDTLDQDTLPSEGQWQQTPAELAFVQLESLWQRHGEGVERVIVVVPAAFTRTQLGLILGMCRKAGMPVTSLVDAAVAALAEPPATRQIVFFDLLLHRICATLCLFDQTLRREASAELDQTGEAGLNAKWAAAIADECVRATRYDPMHTAAAEQALYDAMPDLLERLQSSDSAQLSLPAGEQPINVEVPRASLVRASTPVYREMARLASDLIDSAAGDVHVVLSGRFSRAPEIRTALADATRCPVTILAAHSAVLGVSRDPAPFVIEGEGVGLIVERPAGAVFAAEAPTAVSSQALVPPTHILVDGRIYRLSDRPFVIGTAVAADAWGYRAAGALKGISRRHCTIGRQDDRVVVRDHSTYGTLINGQRVDGEQTVGSGDIVRIGNPGLEVRLVCEELCDGPA